MGSRHRVVIIGGGFGGLYAAQSLCGAPVEVTLIDRRNFHLFQPLLYQVATGGLSPANIASPLRAILKRQKNARVLLGEAVSFDAVRRRVQLADGQVEYDTLLVASGARHNYFGHDRWEAFAPGLKTIEDATEIRRRILSAFENAEREPDRAKVRAWLTFVVIGAGPTGVELAGALGEIARDTLRHDFRHINPADATILLVDAADRVLPTYPPGLSAKAAAALARLGVSVKTRAVVQDVRVDAVVLLHGDQTERIETRTVLWAAGVAASQLGQALAGATGQKLDSIGRVMVAPDLTVPGHPEIFVIGDLAHFSHGLGRPLPGIATVAIQQGRYVADLIQRRLLGEAGAAVPFVYQDRGTMATIGRSAAVVHLGRLRFAGFAAWLVWLFVHLINLIEFQNRLLVLVQWAWNYFTRNRAARLITYPAPPESRDQPGGPPVP